MCSMAVVPIPFGKPSLIASPSFALKGSTANMGCAVVLPTVKKNCYTGAVSVCIEFAILLPLVHINMCE